MRKFLRKQLKRNKKGALSKTMTVIFLVILGLFVFIAGIHPTANTIKEQGQDAGSHILEEKSNIENDFQSLPSSLGHDSHSSMKLK